MSYQGGERRRQGGYDRRGRDERRLPESEETRLRNLVVKLGEESEFLPSTELPNLGKILRNAVVAHVSPISDGFYIGVTEEPYKIPYFAALYTLLLQPESSDVISDDIKDATRAVFDEFCRKFQAALDKLAWRELRLSIQFFSHLSLSKTVSPSTLLALLQSFLVVLDEPGVSHERALAAALCVGEALIRAGPSLYTHDPSTVDSLISALSAYFESTSPQRRLTRPITLLHSSDVPGSEDSLGALLETVKKLKETSFAHLPECLPQPHSLFPESSVSYDIPAFLVPPEDVDFERTGDEGVKRKIVMAAPRIRLFDDEMTPNPCSPEGWVIRSSLTDVVNIFEVNRKECARIILEMPRWFAWGTFQGKTSAGPEPNPEELTSEMGWVLENTTLEVILSDLTLLPFAPQMLVYYFALVTDLCKSSPQTVGPAVGKSFRKLYSLLGEGLDVEIAKRFAEWFAAHMSNFGFNWVWKEWIPDLELPSYHPKRVFIRYVIELETRLAYHDRILKTLPEPFAAAEAQCIPEAAPGPDFEYENPQHPYYEPAQSLLNLIRGRSQIEEVIQLAESLRGSISDTVTLPSDVSSDSVVRTITMQSLLHVGSRSFSHFLNAIERYLPLLRSLGSAPEDKADFLQATGKFWQRNGQMINIVFDKLMQYQIVDPSDIISWCFLSSDRREAGSRGMIGRQEWDLIKAALDKAIGRVNIAQQRVQKLRKEEEDVKAKVKAGKAISGDAMDVDAIEADKALDSDHKAVSENLANAVKAYSALTKEQKNALAQVLDGFIVALGTSPVALSVLTEESLNSRSEWSQAQWESWETWGWFRNFCRSYAAQLRSYAVTLESGPIAKAPTTGENQAAGKLITDVWNIAIGKTDA